MSGALKAGSVYVAVSASIGEFTATMAKLVKGVEDTAKKVKESANGIAEVGKVFAAAMGGAVLASAQSNRAIQSDLEKLKGYFVTMAADLGDAFGPMLRQLTETVGAVAGAFQRLSPSTKEAVARFIAMGAVVGAGAMLLSKAAGGVEAVAKVVGFTLVPALGAAGKAAKHLGKAGLEVFPSLSKSVAAMEAGTSQSLAKVAVSFAGVLLPVAAVAAAVVGLALLAGTLYEAWNSSSSGMKSAVTSAWESIKDLGKKLADTLAGWWATLREYLLSGLRVVLEVAAMQVRGLAKLLAPLAKGLGMDKVGGIFQELQSLTGDKLLKDLQSGASFLADKVSSAANTLAEGAKKVGAEVAEGVSYGLNYSTKGLKRLAKDTGLEDLPGRIKAALTGVTGGKAANIRKPFEAEEVAKVGKGPELGASVREFAAGMSATVKSRLNYLQEQTRRLAEETAVVMASARASLVSKFRGAFGDLSSLADTLATGFAAGGPGGALAAVMGDLLTRSAQFQVLLQTISGVIGMVADWLGRLAEPFIPLIGAISTLIDAGLKALAPALTSITAFIAPLVPSVVVLGELLQGLAPVIALLVSAMTLILNPMQLLAGPALKALFEVLKFASTIILKVTKALADVWNGLVGAVQDVFRSLASISIFGKKPLSFLDGWANGLEGAKADTDAMARALQALTGMTWDAAMAKAEETAEVIRNRQATEKATQALTNVPSAFKYFQRAFEAQDPQGPGGGAAPPSAPAPAPGGGTGWESGTASPWGGSGATMPGQTPGGVGSGNTYINVTATNPDEVADKIDKTLRRQRFERTGSSAAPGRYAVGS